MSIIDKAPEGGKFRAFANSTLDGTAGAWGVGNLLNVTVDSGGELVAASASNIDGVILTSEGQDADLAANKDVIGGRQYTVFRFAEFAEVGTFASPALSAGDLVYATAAGDITITPSAGDVFVGWVLLGGERMILQVGGRVVSV